MMKCERGIYHITSDVLNVKSKSGKELRCTCPACSDTREHPNDPSMCVDTASGVGFCHHCGAKFIVTDLRVTDNVMPAASSSKTEDVAYVDFMKDVGPLSTDGCSFLASRSIDSQVAFKARVGSCVFNGVPWLAFPFYVNGAVVNVQFKRADGIEKGFRFAKGGRMIPWNIDCIANGDGKSPLYVTEGMMDALALMQSGYWNVISVPNGAGSRMEVFDDFRNLICKNFSHIVFAGDTDSAGIELRNRVKDYFKGFDVCTVSWHWRDLDFKDANEMIAMGGTEAVAGCIRNASFERSEGYVMAQCDNRDLLQILRNGRPKGCGIGLRSVDSLIRYLPGYMYVVSGYPGTGKSSFINYVTMRLLCCYGWRTLFYSPEKMPVENHLSELVEIITGKRFDKGCLSEDELYMASEYLSGNVFHLDDRTDDLDILLKRAAVIVRRHGIKVFVIDPFMYLAIKDLRGVSESTMISNMLKRIHMFARDNNVAVIVVAHPRKPNTNAQPPALNEMLFEISGSSGFSNTCDAGIFLVRNDMKSNRLKIMCCKSRNTYICNIGETEVSFAHECGRYFDDDTDDVASIFNNWTGEPQYFQRSDVSRYVSTAVF